MYVFNENNKRPLIYDAWCFFGSFTPVIYNQVSISHHPVFLGKITFID